MKKIYTILFLLVTCGFLLTAESAPVQHKKPSSGTSTAKKKDTRTPVSFWNLDGSSTAADVEKKLNKWGIDYQRLTDRDIVYGFSCTDIEYQYNYYKKITFYVDGGTVYQIDLSVEKVNQFKEELSEKYENTMSGLVWTGKDDVRIEYSPISKKFCFIFREINKK